MKAIIVANWKMNPASFKEARALFEATKKAADRAKSVSVIVAPPSLYLRDLAASYRGKRLQFAAQNAHWDEQAAHTGEISIAQAKDAGAKAILIGHAERRALGETNEDTRKKVAEALRLKLTPILCVGEKARGQEGDHFAFIKDELRAGFADVPQSSVGKILVAYEPLWAIGASAAMEPRGMHEMAIFIRKMLVEMHGASAQNVKVLYGGSIDAENAPAMLQGGDIAGLLVGRVCADPKQCAELLSAVQRA